MSSFSESELNSMIYLLDDSDERVVAEICEHFENMGPDVIPFLEDYAKKCENLVVYDRINQIIFNIDFQKHYDQFKAWVESPEQDLLEALILLDSVIVSDNKERTLERFNKIKVDVWLAINQYMTSFEIVKSINYVLLEKYKFQEPTENVLSTIYSSLSYVMWYRKSTQTFYSCLYLIIAKKLKLPIVGIRLPNQIVLGYLKDDDWQMTEKFNSAAGINVKPNEEILFYFNPTNQEAIYSVAMVKQFLENQDIPLEDKYLRACSHSEIIAKIIEDLIKGYSIAGNHTKTTILKKTQSLLMKSIENDKPNS